MMPVIAWNALHATRILGQAMRVLDRTCVARHPGRRRARAASCSIAAPRSPRRSARYIGYAADRRRSRRLSVETGRPIRDLVRERRLLPDDALDAILSPEAMTSPGPSRPAKGRKPTRARTTSLETALVTLVRAVALALVAPPPATAQQRQHARQLFPPEDLGLLEGPDRDVWQRPEQIMDALNIAEAASSLTSAPASGWFTIRLARRVGPNGRVYAEDIQPQMIEVIKRRVDARETVEQRRDQPRHCRSIRSCRRQARRRAHRRRVSRDGAAGGAPAQRRDARSSRTGASASSNSPRTAAARAADRTSASIPNVSSARRTRPGCG